MQTVDKRAPADRIDDLDLNSPGAYALVLELHKKHVLHIGRLGEWTFEPGIFLYFGSALGPGGLRGRLRRHLRPPDGKRQQWHIDALTAVGQMREIWWLLSSERMECDWAAAAAEHAWKRPARFGASDCRCEGHLLQFVDLHNATRVREKIQDAMNTTIHRACMKDCQE